MVKELDILQLLGLSRGFTVLLVLVKVVFDERFENNGSDFKPNISG